jgi:meso-butanediol dehydrogenase/(S,S)-butanediol dehydrogenase/diacetyl reductase
MNPLEGQGALVTGGASGIGRAVAFALADAGAAVAVVDLDAAGARETALTITASGGSAVAIHGDVTRADDVASAIAEAAALRDRLDVVVNSAGFCRVRPFLELDEAEFTEMWAVHALGTFLVCRSALPHMMTRGYGRIVNVVSGQDGHGASPWTSHYQSAKAAQTSLGRGIALAVAGHGITVNAVSPGLVVTPLWDRLDDDYRATFGRSAQDEIDRRIADAASYPLGRAVEPEEVARVVLFLADPGSGAITGEVVNT